jgi:hypothetical protein
MEPAAFEDGVRRMGRAQHHVADPAGSDSGLGNHVGDRLAYASGHIGRSGLLGLGDQHVLTVENDCVGVRSTDVDAES